MSKLLLQGLNRKVTQVIATSFILYFSLYFLPFGPIYNFIRAWPTDGCILSERPFELYSAYSGVWRGPFWGYTAWAIGEDWFDDVGLASKQSHVCQTDPQACIQGLFRGDFRYSWTVAQGNPVSEVIAQPLVISLRLTVSVLLLSILLTLPIGVLAALRPTGVLSRFVGWAATTMRAIPLFWVASMTILVFGGPTSVWHKVTGLPFLPTGNSMLLRPQPLAGSLHAVLAVTPHSWQDIAIHLILPTVVLSLMYVAPLSYLTQRLIAKALHQSDVRTVRLSRFTVQDRVARQLIVSVLVPFASAVIMGIPSFIGSLMLVETVFNQQGAGRLFVKALERNDYPVAMALLLGAVALATAAMLLRDLLPYKGSAVLRFSEM